MRAILVASFLVAVAFGSVTLNTYSQSNCQGTPSASKIFSSACTHNNVPGSYKGTCTSDANMMTIVCTDDACSNNCVSNSVSAGCNNDIGSNSHQYSCSAASGVAPSLVTAGVLAVAAVFMTL
jgi:hypothetical protein